MGPDFDFIDKKMLTELHQKAIVYLTCLCNGILRTGHFPTLWKVLIQLLQCQIIMVPKPGRPSHDVSGYLYTYRPINLLPVLSKIFEKILLQRLIKALLSQPVIPDHQVRFRTNHATVEHIHRVCKVIRTSLENEDIVQQYFWTFNRPLTEYGTGDNFVKSKTCLPHKYYEILASHLSERLFRVREGESTSACCDIFTGVPQGSVLCVHNIHIGSTPTLWSYSS